MNDASPALAPVIADIDTNPIIALDNPKIWSEPGFQERLFKSLERDGFGQECIQEFGIVLVDAVESFSDLKQVIEKRSASLSNSGLAQELRDVIAHLEDVREHNATIYKPSSPDDVKQRWWPSNPKSLELAWENYISIYDVNLCVTPKRFITKDTPIVSAGSCFARNISRQLQVWEYNYLIEMGLRPDEIEDPLDYERDPARCGNIYNPLSMAQMIQRAFGEWEPERIAMWSYPRVMEAYRGRADSTDVDDYFNVEWKEHNAALARAMKKAEVFVLTLGTTEAWITAHNGLAVSVSPKKGELSLYRHVNLTLDQILESLEVFYDTFKRHNPNIKIIASVSPVPLNATFNKDRHVVVANA